MRRWRVLLAALAVLWLSDTALAQEQAALVADRISVTAGNRLRAEGNVEVLYQGARLKARAITYSAARDQITIEGPLSLSRGEEFILIADAGELDADLRNGILTSARLVLDRQLQVAGTELRRVDGRYTQLFRAVGSTCRVCSASEVPLWQIRASRVVHDQQERQVYYDNALFEVYGLPVFYLPRLRMPDPSVERATGFLLPRLKTSSILGTGIQVPYFIEAGDHADVTLRPYLSQRTTTLGLRYRQLWKTGAVSFQGAVSQDDLVPGSTRGYVFGNGVFFLPRDFELRFNIEATTDDSYLFDYGISGQDRLESNLSLGRVRRDSYFSAKASNFESFRDDEKDSAIPAQLGEIDHRRSFTVPGLGGTAEYRLQAFGLARASNVDITGRDYTRLSAGLAWRGDRIVGPGIVVAGEARADLDHYIIGQDSTTDGATTATATAALDLSWPLTKRGSGGATHVVEPRLQFVYSNAETATIPNEESTLVEFDEGNLWSLDRLPGASDHEIGNRINAGVTWTRYDPAGWSGALTLGRVFRERDTGQFNPATGLVGANSNWLVAARLDLGNGFLVANRLLLGDDLSINRNDARLRWHPGTFSLDMNFLWHIAEPEVGRDLDTWELHSAASFPLARNWEATADFRYDFVTDRAASAGVNLTYKTRCITADFGFLRTFTSSESVTPKTDFTIALSVPPGAVASTRPTTSCGR